MSNAQSAEMVFTSHRADTGDTAAPPALVASPARIDDGPMAKIGQRNFELLIDRIEQLEFALAEAVLRTDEQGSAPLSHDALEALSARIDALTGAMDGVKPPAAADADLADKIGRISDRLDAAAAARADDTAMLAARISALEEGTEKRFAPIESALQALAQNQLKASDGGQDATSEIIARIDTLPTADRLEQILGDAGLTNGHLRAEIDRMADGIAALEAKLAARITRISEGLEAMAERPSPPPDLAPLREMTARHMVAQKTISDRHAKQISQLAERFAAVETELRTLSTLDGLDGLIGASLEAGTKPILKHLGDLSELMASIDRDLKESPDLTKLAEPLLARMDRLDTTAEQRQREMNSELADIAARPQPVNDLTPIRESFARLMVAMQTMHQSRETAEADFSTKLNTLVDNLQSLPDRLEASSEQRQRDLQRDVEALAERPIPAPDLTPVQETLSRFLVALQSHEDARANSNAELTARFALLAERIEGIPKGAGAEEIAQIRAALDPIAGTIGSLETAVDALATRPAPTVDSTALRNVFSKQMVALNTWMQRQDVLQRALSDLLETLVERGARGPAEEDLLETLKTMIAASQFSTRKQVEGAEGRLSSRIETLAGAIDGTATETSSGPNRAAGICQDDLRLFDALQDLRRMVADHDDPEQIGMQARELRTALAETLATMQAGQTVRI